MLRKRATKIKENIVNLRLNWMHMNKVKLFVFYFAVFINFTYKTTRKNKTLWHETVWRLMRKSRKICTIYSNYNDGTRGIMCVRSTWIIAEGFYCDLAEDFFVVNQERKSIGFDFCDEMRKSLCSSEDDGFEVYLFPFSF